MVLTKTAPANVIKTYGEMTVEELTTLLDGLTASFQHGLIPVVAAGVSATTGIVTAELRTRI